MTGPTGRPGSLRDRARSVLDEHWRHPGFCVPNAATYPWQWLWDSCFHAVVWAHLGEGDRARRELANALAHQAPSGFVPHLTYWDGAGGHAGFWGREGTSTITQPPMYGHAVAELVRLGIDVGDDLVHRAEAGLAHLLEDRRGVVFHPWETGCDDSPRWDDWCPDGWSPDRWFEAKGDFTASLRFAEDGTPVDNPRFAVRSAGFAALVVFNERELAAATGRPVSPVTEALVDWLAGGWDGALATWVDEPIAGRPSSRAPARSSARIRTADALLPVLVADAGSAASSAVFDALADPGAHGGSFGPTGVHREEATYDPVTYWRGPVWPQLVYLLWIAARRHGRHENARRLADQLQKGAVRSGFAEYWHPDTGEGLGATPQSWTTLAVVVDPDRADRAG